MKIKKLLENNQSLTECAVWDAASAKQAERLGFHVVTTLSSVFADMFGYEDGKQLSFSEVKFMLERISKNTSLPLSVDLEYGYSEDPLIVAENIKDLHRLGVVSVNLEDSRLIGKPHLIDSEVNAEKIAIIKQKLALSDIEVFINARIDTYYLKFYGVEHPNPLEETLNRVALYQQAGADGIFVPGASEDLPQIINATNLPVTVVVDPENIEKYKKLGVKRICLSNDLYVDAMKHLEKRLSGCTNTRI